MKILEDAVKKFGTIAVNLNLRIHVSLNTQKPSTGECLRMLAARLESSEYLRKFPQEKGCNQTQILLGTV
jgi:hypothetical protein